MQSFKGTEARVSVCTLPSLQGSVEHIEPACLDFLRSSPTLEKCGDTGTSKEKEASVALTARSLFIRFCQRC